MLALRGQRHEKCKHSLVHTVRPYFKTKKTKQNKPNPHLYCGLLGMLFFFQFT